MWLRPETVNTHVRVGVCGSVHTESLRDRSFALYPEGSDGAFLVTAGTPCGDAARFDCGFLAAVAAVPQTDSKGSHGSNRLLQPSCTDDLPFLCCCRAACSALWITLEIATILWAGCAAT